MKLNWFKLIRLVAPIVINAVKPELAPIVDDLTNGIQEAEKLKDSSQITDKLLHVKLIAANAAHAVNTAAQKQVVNPDQLDQAVTDGVSAAVDVANLLHKKIGE